MKKNITLRVNKELCEKYQKKFNMSLLFECMLRNLNGETFEIDKVNGKIYQQKRIEVQHD